MSLGKTATNVINSVTVSANSDSSESSGIDLSAATDFAIGYKLTFNASATLGARIDLYADASGVSASFTLGAYDDPCDSGDIAVDAGHTVQGLIQMQRSAKYVKAKIHNLDASYSITSASLWSIVQTP